MTGVTYESADVSHTAGPYPSQWSVSVSEEYDPAIGSRPGSAVYISFSLRGATARVTLAGYDGYLTVPVTKSADGRESSVTVTDGRLVGKEYRQLSGFLTNYLYSTVSNPDSHYGEGCDCWYVRSSDFSDGEPHYFAGFHPNVVPPPLSALTTAEARSYARQVLAGKFKRAYRRGTAKRISCTRRLSRTSRGCRVSWRFGRFSYRGGTKIWITGENGGEDWNYSLSIVRIDRRSGHRRVFRVS